MKKKSVYLVLALLFLLTALGGVLMGMRLQKTQSEAEQLYQDLQQQSHAEDVQPVEAEPTEALATPTPMGEAVVAEATEAQETIPLPEIPDLQPDWDALQAQNPDIYAWISLPGTTVDYPVLQHPNDDSFYLNHNLDGSKGNPGCIYTEGLYNTKDFKDPNTVLYGHNFDNDTMFSSLHRFEDADFFAEDHYIFIYRPDGDPLVYQVFAAYERTNLHLLGNFDTHNVYAFSQYVKEIFMPYNKVANYREDVAVDGSSRLITLSTCTKTHDKSLRYIVQGVLLNPDTEEDELPNIDL